MLSISKMQTAKQAESYLTKENYYQSDSEKGHIFCKDEKLLKLFGLEQGQEINHDINTSLIRGFNPKNGKALSKNAGAEDRRAGLDLTTSLNKDFSILLEYYKLNDEEKYNELLEVHIKANALMMKEVNNYIQTRVYNELGDRVKVKADCIYTSFLHDVTREIEGSINPQIHSHNFVYNMVRIEDKGKEKIMSLNLDELFKKDVKKYLGQIYRSEISNQLINKGYELENTNIKEGFFKFKDFEDKDIDEFSATSIFIKSKLEEWKIRFPNANESKLKNMINAHYKKAKKEVDRDGIFKINNERIKELGIDETIKNIELNRNKKNRENTIEKDVDVKVYLKRAYKDITNFESVFSKELLIKESLKQCVHLGITKDQIIDAILEDDEVIKLHDGNYTTKELVDCERWIISQLGNKNYAIDSNLEKVEAYEKELIRKSEKNKGFNKGQKDAVNTFVSSDSQYLAIQGDAGSGKTFAMKAVNSLYKEEYELIGLAPTGKAASGLEDESGIKSMTLDKYLISKETSKTDKKRLFIVDESSMIDSLKMYRFMNKLDENDKVVFIGDTKQLQSVGAGKIFEDMQKFGIETVFVTENMRQASDEDKETVELIKQNKIEKVFKRLENRIFEKDTKDDLLEQIVNDYEKDDVVIAARNADKDYLNVNIREKIKPKASKDYKFTTLKNVNISSLESYHSSSFKIGDLLQVGSGVEGFKSGQKMRIKGFKDDKTLIVETMAKKPLQKELTLNENVIQSLQVFREKEIPLMKNELIIFTKTYENKKNGVSVKNGTRAKIREIKGNMITVETDANRVMEFNIKDLPYIDYSYSITNFKSQGMSINHVKVLLDESMANIKSFYTEITRMKLKIELYTTNQDLVKARIEEGYENKSTLDYQKELENGTRSKRDIGKSKIHDEKPRGTEKGDSRNLSNISFDFRGTIRRIRECIANYRKARFDFRKVRAKINNPSLAIAEKVNKIKKLLPPEDIFKALNLNKDNYEVSKNKKGEFSIKTNDGKIYNSSDFLTKHLNLNWNETKEILFNNYKEYQKDLLAYKVTKNESALKSENKKINNKDITNEKINTKNSRNERLYKSVNRINERGTITSSSNNMRTLSEISMVHDRRRTQMLLSTNELNKLDSSREGKGNYQMRWSDTSNNGITSRHGEQLEEEKKDLFESSKSQDEKNEILNSFKKKKDRQLER